MIQTVSTCNLKNIICSKNSAPTAPGELTHAESAPSETTAEKRKVTG
jgi:hypothetical protein